MYQCFNCLQTSVIWDSDFDFEDYDYEGEGIVHILHCSNCGAEIEYRVPVQNYATRYLKCKPVVEVESGKVMQRWESARSAAKDLYLTRQTVMNYCNNKTKRKQFNLMWEEDYYGKEKGDK